MAGDLDPRSRAGAARARAGPATDERVRLGARREVPQPPRQRLADERAVLEVLGEPLGLAPLALGHRPRGWCSPRIRSRSRRSTRRPSDASTAAGWSARFGCSSNPYRTTARLAAFTSSSRVDRPRVRRRVQDVGVGRRLARDREHRLAELVQPLLRLGLGRLDHQRLGDDQREVDRRRVEAVVHQPLGDVERRDAVLLLQRPRREDELVHAQPVERQVVRVLQPGEQVVGVQHGRPPTSRGAPARTRGCTRTSGRRRRTAR